MTTPKIQLKQEGIVRPSGYQLVQWVTSHADAPNDTDPDSLEPLFVLRNASGRELFERVATPLDLSQLEVNPLSYFEAKSADGFGWHGAIAGDVLRFASIETWLQTSAPYTDCDFIVAAVENLASGTGPQVLTGNRVILPGYAPTSADLGRWVVLTGFATTGYNTTVQVLGIVGNVLQVDLTTTTNETGAGWALRRLRVESNAGSTLEPRYFPTLVARATWQVLRGATVIASGTQGYTQRLDPTATTYRDRRVTVVAATQQAALDVATVTRRGVELLQLAAEVDGTSFLGVQTHDYPPT